MIEAAIADLSRRNVLRAGVNLGNILLVTGESTNGDPEGISPDMAAKVANQLGVKVEYITYATPGAVADAADRDEWDIGLIAAEPKRAEKMSFCPAYVEIEASYLVRVGSPFQSISDVDAPGINIAVSARAAYDLYLSRKLQHATLHRAEGLPGAFDLFVNNKLDALAGLAPALRDNAKTVPGLMVLNGGYTSIQQAIGTQLGKVALNNFVEKVIDEAVVTGFVAELIKKHGVSGKLQAVSV